MGYGTKRNEYGEVLIYPLELPLYEGNTRELAQQASTNLISCLRHLAVIDAFVDNGLDGSQEELNDILTQELDLGTQQLIACVTSLASIANLYSIDIMQEIYNVPWMV